MARYRAGGCHTGRLKTAEGPIEYSVPPIARRDQSLRSITSQGPYTGLEDVAIEMLAATCRARY